MSGGYNRALVEQLLFSVWDPEASLGVRNPYAPDPDMPKARGNPKIQSPLPAHLADLRRGWERAPLTMPERRAMFCVHGADMTQTGAAKVLDLPRTTVIGQVERGVGKLVAWLNGDEWTEGYDAELSQDDVADATS